MVEIWNLLCLSLGEITQLLFDLCYKSLKVAEIFILVTCYVQRLHRHTLHFSVHVENKKTHKHTRPASLVLVGECSSLHTGPSIVPMSYYSETPTVPENRPLGLKVQFVRWPVILETNAHHSKGL